MFQFPDKFNPFDHKMFNQDIFTYNDGNVNILHSSAKMYENYSRCISIRKFQTFGRVKDKFLYKCIPDDKRIPIFLVPYKIKPGFSKSIKNKYVVFEFKEWNDKHPIGVINDKH